MKLKNPDLRTSFFLIHNCKRFHIFTFEVICGLTSEGTFHFYLYGVSYEGENIPLPMPMFIFESPEEAFTMADIICSSYPHIKFDLDSFHQPIEDYPEFDMEVFKNEH